MLFAAQNRQILWQYLVTFIFRKWVATCIPPLREVSATNFLCYSGIAIHLISSNDKKGCSQGMTYLSLLKELQSLDLEKTKQFELKSQLNNGKQ